MIMLTRKLFCLIMKYILFSILFTFAKLHSHNTELYTDLGLNFDASDEDIRKAY